MKKEGFKIKTIDTNEVNDIKQKAGLQLDKLLVIQLL